VRRGQIRTALLALLEDEPMHGYEMIRQIDERSGGRWKPSPGAVYPTLQQLADEGLISAAEESGKNVFSLTDEGRAVAADLGDEDREPWTADAGGSTVWELKAQMRQLGMAAAAAMAGSPEQVDRALTVLADARRSLYAILAEDPGTAAAATGEDQGDA
jgi:DNA-binding PadR family transcriptional regulator